MQISSNFYRIKGNCVTFTQIKVIFLVLMVIVCFLYLEQLEEEVFYAVESGDDVKLIERLLILGASGDAFSHYFYGTPLHEAALKNHTSVIRLLLDRGANINARDAENQTALHKAAWNNCTSAMLLLLDRGAHHNAKTVSNQTPLDLARWRNNQEAIDLLMDFSESVEKV